MAASGNWRESLHIEGVSHGNNPIPAGTRVGNMVFSGGIMGTDPATGKVPENDPARQTELAFQHLKSLIENAGGTLEDVGRVTVFAKDLSIREHVNREWVKHFPDEHSRPSRHTQLTDLRGGMLIQLEVVAVLKNR